MFFRKQKIANIKRGDIISLSLRNFKVKTRRTFLTVLGIGVSFATIFFLISLGYGLQNILLKQIASKDALLTLNAYSTNQEILRLDSNAVAKMLSINNVQKADPIISMSGQVEFPNTAFEASISGVSQDFFRSSEVKLRSGRYPRTGESGIIMTTDVERISGQGDILNKQVKLVFHVPKITDSVEEIKIIESEENYKITGIIENSTGKSAYVPIEKVSQFGLPYDTVKVVVKSEKDMENARLKIADMGFAVSSVADTIDQANKIFNILKIILAFFGVAALIVAIVGMINTMTIALLERTNEIGVMKIFGITESDVQKLFMIEATLIGFSGGVVGLAIGFAFSQVFNLGIMFLANALGGKSVNLFHYPIWFIVSIIVFASLVGLITGFFPSRRAAKLDPLAALRYK